MLWRRQAVAALSVSVGLMEWKNLECFLEQRYVHLRIKKLQGATQSFLHLDVFVQIKKLKINYP